jgi:hypothetical protein
MLTVMAIEMIGDLIETIDVFIFVKLKMSMKLKFHRILDVVKLTSLPPTDTTASVP